jgi:hypothetical protein
LFFGRRVIESGRIDINFVDFVGKERYSGGIVIAVFVIYYVEMGLFWISGGFKGYTVIDIILKVFDLLKKIFNKIDINSIIKDRHLKIILKCIKYNYINILTRNYIYKAYYNKINIRKIKKFIKNN